MCTLFGFFLDYDSLKQKYEDLVVTNDGKCAEINHLTKELANSDRRNKYLQDKLETLESKLGSVSSSKQKSNENPILNYTINVSAHSEKFIFFSIYFSVLFNLYLINHSNVVAKFLPMESK